MKLNWNFKRGGWSLKKISFVGLRRYGYFMESLHIVSLVGYVNKVFSPE